ncbi:MAG: cytochrome b/b6 domain-containing protein [Sphingobacteriaceae bacterium]|nr:cytochrome b/b6 domain-containing protein [Sphingobacteriaceae bacterium]
MQYRPYTALYRILHWSIAICMILLLFTIFLRLTWLEKNHVAAIIQDFLGEKGVALSQDDAILLAKKIRKPMWQWHIYLGYALTGLYSLRMLLPLFGKMPFSSPFNAQLDRQTKIQYSIYLIFYALVAVSLTTGLLIEFGPKSIKAPMEEIHELSIYYLVGYMILHIGGVLLADFTKSPGIISRIISGKSQK